MQNLYSNQLIFDTVIINRMVEERYYYAVALILERRGAFFYRIWWKIGTVCGKILRAIGSVLSQSQRKEKTDITQHFTAHLDIYQMSIKLYLKRQANV